MEVVVLILFAAGLLLAIRLPALAAALTILMIPLEQVVQGAAPSLRVGGGGQAVNYLVGGVCLMSSSLAILRERHRLQHVFNTTMVLTLAQFIWATISLGWSPGRESGIEMVRWGFPYLVVTILLAPILISSIADYVAFNRWTIIVGTLIIFGYLVNPQFEMKLGRLTMQMGGGMVSSALAVGELGGTVLISAALARGGGLGALGFAIRVIAGVSGVVLAVQSGSRGQFFFAVLVVLLFIPIAAPILSIRRFIASVVTIGILCVVVYYAMGFILEGFAAKRFETDQLLYGSSSASGRIRNVGVLLEAWLRDPKAIFVGLGYNAFAALPGSNGEPYSHVMMADAVFELGLAGLAITLAGFYLPISEGILLFRRHLSTPVHRAAIATLLAQILYQFLLINKQGSLWGVPVIFFYLVSAARLWQFSIDETEPPLLESDDEGSGDNPT